MAEQGGQMEIIRRLRLYPEHLALSDAHQAIKIGHFVYGDGTHGKVWVDTKSLLSRTQLVDSYASDLGASFFSNFKAVVCPAVKGIPLAFAIAARWGEIAVWLDKRVNGYGETIWTLDDCFLNRIKGRKVLLVDDVIQTGLTLAVAKKKVELAGGKVIGAAVIWNRSANNRFFEKVPLRAIIERSFEAFRSSFLPMEVFAGRLRECPLCLKRTHINTDYGKGRRFLEQLVLSGKGDVAIELGWRAKIEKL